MSFLRGDHDFLTAAIHHPKTRFVLLKDLNPMIEPSGKLGFVAHSEVVPLIGMNPYMRTEVELINDYDSQFTIPQVVFLGLDENGHDGLNYKSYVGDPYFSLDITPKSWYKDVATRTVERLENRGMDFSKNKFQLRLPAKEGMKLTNEKESSS